jgi:hypothetical protein
MKIPWVPIFQGIFRKQESCSSFLSDKIFLLMATLEKKGMESGPPKKYDFNNSFSQVLSSESGVLKEMLPIVSLMF